MKRRWGLLVLLSVVACGTVIQFPWDHAEKLALSGAIEQNAPVKSSLEITINAPPEKVWGLLTDLKNWPSWQPAITETEFTSPLAVGTPFSWKMGGNEIHSKIAVVLPVSQFVWTGKAFGARAIHVWKLQRLAGDRTLVHMEESMEGLLIRAFYSSEQLNESDLNWLKDLKVAAER